MRRKVLSPEESNEHVREARHTEKRLLPICEIKNLPERTVSPDGILTSNVLKGSKASGFAPVAVFSKADHRYPFQCRFLGGLEPHEKAMEVRIPCCKVNH